MMFSGVPFLLGYLLLTYAHYTRDVSVFNGVLMTGRALAGFGMGWASTVSPVSILVTLPYNYHLLISPTPHYVGLNQNLWPAMGLRLHNILFTRTRNTLVYQDKKLAIIIILIY